MSSGDFGTRLSGETSNLRVRLSIGNFRGLAAEIAGLWRGAVGNL